MKFKTFAIRKYRRKRLSLKISRFKLSWKICLKVRCLKRILSLKIVLKNLSLKILSLKIVSENFVFKNFILTRRLSGFEILNNASSIFQKWLVTRHFANIFHYLNFSEEYLWQFSLFIVTIRNYDVCKNHNLIMNLIFIWRKS